MIHAIVNANAKVGRKQKASEVLARLLSEAGREHAIHLAKDPGDTIELCKQLSSVPGEKEIWVAGGDGTVHEAINGLQISDELKFVYLPGGSGNDLARGLGLPLSLEKAAKAVLASEAEKQYDYGELELFGEGVRRFAGSSGMGYDAKVCEEVENSRLKKRLNRIGLGKLAYFLVAVKQVFANPRFQMTLIADGGVSRSYGDVIFICMMNHRFEGGGLKMAPKADPCDGKISVAFAYGIRPWRVLFALPKLMRGSHVKMKGVITFDCDELELITDRKQFVHGDGEVLGEYRHLKVRCGAGKIRMPEV